MATTDKGCPLQAMMERFSIEVALLKDQACLQGAPLQSEQEWMALEATVESLEIQLDDIRSSLEEEAEGEAALLELKAKLQAEERDLEELERRIPNQNPPVANCNDGNVLKQRNSEPRHPSTTGGGKQKPGQHLGGQKGAKPLQKQSEVMPKQVPTSSGAPGQPVSESELAALQSHVRGRHTAAKVNAVLEELVKTAQSNQQLMKLSALKVPDEHQERHKVLTSVFWSKEHFKRMPVLDTEIKGGQSVKQILTILRTLGRIVEVKHGKGTRIWELV